MAKDLGIDELTELNRKHLENMCFDFLLKGYIPCLPFQQAVFNCFKNRREKDKKDWWEWKMSPDMFRKIQRDEEELYKRNGLPYLTVELKNEKEEKRKTFTEKQKEKKPFWRNLKKGGKHGKQRKSWEV